ncbi:hypothetical protein F7725_023976 [Dissostichus mawsoni]|uniref:Uncharacterized protein n=1 Tax=Dissostichus mawsoni TaxID=36200 RepID=A0A7J5XY07_DISMA|nr:hypothetical protein F7725_023976 [Dissostichus mawsoni]
MGQEKKWFTDEPENAYPRNIQIKPMSTHMANQPLVVIICSIALYVLVHLLEEQQVGSLL